MKPYGSFNEKEHELIDVLTAISRVSSRMARNLAFLNLNNGFSMNTKILITKLQKVADLLNSVLMELTDAQSSDALPARQEETAQITPEKEEPQLTLEDVRGVLAELSRAGHTDAIRALLEKYGAVKLSEVPPQHYRDLLKDAGNLNA